MYQILLVDDDVELRELTQKYLQRNGYQVVVASNGWDAIREIVVNKPDLVVMDIEMPKLSGLNALDILRVSRLTDQLPIIVTSAHGDKDTILKAVQRGADDFIVKPYSFNELATRISTLLFQLDFDGLKKILTSIAASAQPSHEAIWSGLDASRYQDWGAFACLQGEREFCILLQKGLTLEKAQALDEEQMSHQVMVLTKFRNVWKCVWPISTVADADSKQVKKSA